MKNNKDGHVMEVGMLLILLLTALTLYFILVWQKNSALLVDRSQTYLCFKKISTFTRPYIKQMNLCNQIIHNTQLAGTLAIFIPGLSFLGLSSKAIKEVVKKIQQGLHLNFQRQVATTISSCPSALSFATSPYQSVGAILKRNTDETVPLRSTIWKPFIQGKYLLLSGIYSFTSHLSPKHRLAVQEIPLARGNGKEFFGSFFSPSFWSSSKEFI